MPYSQPTSFRQQNHRSVYRQHFGYQLCRSLLTINEIGFFLVAISMIFVELIMLYQIIQRVPYTEIDWKTYMQQVGCYLKGERNYFKITGDTGPIVYPAAHLYIYRIFYSLTDEGKNIRRAQYIFASLYLLNLLVVFRMYFKSKRIPPFVLCLICLSSYRIHSIFVLRLFNDPIAIAAIGVKMNILLFAPALFFILLLSNGLTDTFCLLLVCGFIQFFISFEFLFNNPLAYLSRAFELNRVFLYKWTVNWRILPKELFLDKRFHLLLLLFHLAFLGLFALKVWFSEQGGLKNLLKRLWFGIRTRLDTHDILFALFTANLIGITFARSLHYQFYCWYYHSIPYLLFSPIYRFDHLSYKGDNDSYNNIDIPFKSVLLRFFIL
uniref:dolichyl-P-Man:Man5GlcNAc2-PP-dolichol alpha-1,3-mannosyltransferase n=1 Tax=Meloidogyne hapla TaxID=6305 RepID=A0A1I8C2H5_MELHA